MRTGFCFYGAHQYERQPKDEGIIPPTECPRCHVIYDKIKDENKGACYTAKQQRIKGGEFQKNVGTTGKTKKSGRLVVFIFIVVVGISIGYYFYMNKRNDLVSIAQMNVRIFTTSI
jgi:hypothetical protein